MSPVIPAAADEEVDQWEAARPPQLGRKGTQPQHHRDHSDDCLREKYARSYYMNIDMGLDPIFKNEA